MKLGFMFFTYLDRVIVAARRSIIPLALLIVLMPWRHKKLWAMVPFSRWDLLVVLEVLIFLAVFISLITLPLHVPNSAKMMRFIEKYEQGFEHRLKEQFEKKRQVNIQLLKGYAYGNGPHFSRKVESKELLPYLVVIAVVNTSDGTWFVSETKSLMTAKPCDRLDFRVEDSALFDIQEVPHDRNHWFKQLCICYGTSEVEIVTKDDYHYRAFINTLNSLS